jgi:hypothetical protein
MPDQNSKQIPDQESVNKYRIKSIKSVNMFATMPTPPPAVPVLESTDAHATIQVSAQITPDDKKPVNEHTVMVELWKVVQQLNDECKRLRAERDEARTTLLQKNTELVARDRIVSEWRATRTSRSSLESWRALQTASNRAS